MYCADCEIKLKGNKTILSKVLNELRTCITNRNESEREFVYCRRPDDFEREVNLNNEEFENALKNIKQKRGIVSIKLSLALPLNQSVSRTEDINDWEMLETASEMMADESMYVFISWEGPSDEHWISWTVKNKELEIECFDQSSDWEDADYDEEEYSEYARGAATKKYVYVDGEWVMVEPPSHLPYISEEDAAWMKSIDSWTRLNEEREKANSVITDFVRNYITDELWKKNIYRYMEVFGENKMKKMQSQEETQVHLIFDEIEFDFEQYFISNVYEFFDKFMS